MSRDCRRMSSPSLPLSVSLCLALFSACQLTPADDLGEVETSESGEGDTGETGDLYGDVCEPRDPSVFFDSAVWNIWTFEPAPGELLDLDWTCTVSQVDTSQGLYLLLDCPEAAAPTTSLSV